MMGNARALISRLMPTDRFFVPFLYAIFLLVSLAPYYRHDFFVLGGEGNYVLDFGNYAKEYGFTWYPAFGTGQPNPIPNGIGLNVLVLWLIENASGSARFANFILIFSVFWAPFFAMYSCCRKIGASVFVSISASLFYCLNPFMLVYLNALTPGSVFSVAVMPLFLWIMLKFYKDSFKLFFFFGLASACFSFTFANPPTFAVILFSCPISLMITSYIRDGRLSVFRMAKRFFLMVSALILFNAWWLLSLLMTLAFSQKVYTWKLAHELLVTSAQSTPSLLAKLFLFNWSIPSDPTHGFFSLWFTSTISTFILLIPIVLVICLHFWGNLNPGRGRLRIHLFGILLLTVFFAKGVAAPFGNVYNFLFRYFPLFYLFKSPTEKFGILYMYIFSIFLLLVIMDLKSNKLRDVSLKFLTAYGLFCAFPALSGNLIPEYKLNFGDCYASRQYVEKPEYRRIRTRLSMETSDARVLSFPGYHNYQVCLMNHDSKFYTGMDPLLFNINKPSISSFNRIDILYQDIDPKTYGKILRLFNIETILINTDKFPWFGSVERESVGELIDIFSAFMTPTTLGNLIIFEGKEKPVPHIYVLQK